MNNINITKLTSVELLRKANSFTTGHESHMDLATAYKYGHSPIRTQLFWIEMRDIPLFCASQFVRSHVGVQWYQRSKRTDRGGEDFEKVCVDIINQIAGEYNDEAFDVERISRGLDKLYELPKHFDRYAPTDLACLINAEAIINMSHKRLCAKASKETREIWIKVISELAKVDPCLIEHCLPPCVASGLCREPKSCGFTNSDLYKQQRESYLKLFE